MVGIDKMRQTRMGRAYRQSRLDPGEAVETG
jgi:hypothetical protein